MATGFVAIQDVEVVCEGDNVTLTKATAPEPIPMKLIEATTTETTLTIFFESNIMNTSIF